MSFKAFSRDSDNTVLLSIKSKRSQSALEYMMTYGWAILIIVIVAVILYSMGIFNPSSSITTTITGFQSLGVTQANCINSVNNQILELYITNNVGYPVNITSINVTGNNGLKVTQEVGSTLNPGASSSFYVNGACNKSSSSYSGSATITYTELGQPLPGPYVSTGSLVKVPSKNNPDLVGNFTNSSQIQTNHGYQAPSYLTITMWVKINYYSGGFAISGFSSISEGFNGGCCNWRLEPEASVLSYDPGYWGDKVVGWSINKNTWYMLTMVLQNVSGSNNLYWIYLNKTLVIAGSASSSVLGIPPVNYIDIGYGPGSSPSLAGNIANVQIYGSALSPAQISALFSNGIGGAPLSNSNLMGWWPLDGNANDYSSNNNNGVASGVNWVSP